jgi:hypothetical protein
MVAAEIVVDYHGARFSFVTRNPKRRPALDGDPDGARTVPALRG